MGRGLTLGVLDQSPIRQGGTAAQALRETVELARAAERLGYERFWVAEHHNTSTFAGTAPEILIALIAANTLTIRVGSGGVMLSHYSALKVAETFRVLAAFFPGRIDVGIGRAPGSDPKTAVALADPKPVADINQFPRQVTDLLGFLSGRLPPDHQFSGIRAQPDSIAPEVPDVWLLGSSDYSALLAAKLGLPFAFADFFGNAGDFGPEIAEMYRQRFQPSQSFAEPRFSAAVSVICADTDARAREVASSMQLMIAQIRTSGRRVALLPPEEAVQYLNDSQVGRLIASFSRHYIVGSPASVRTQLTDAAERYGTTDIIIATNCYSFDDRVRSFELVSEAILSPSNRGIGSTTCVRETPDKAIREPSQPNKLLDVENPDGCAPHLDFDRT